MRVICKLDNGKEITLAVLSRENEIQALDLYINVTQSVSLSLKGAPKGTEVSLSGYYEPSMEDADDDMFAGMGAEEDDDDELSDEEEVQKVSAKSEGAGKGKKENEVEKLNSALKQAQLNT